MPTWSSMWSARLAPWTTTGFAAAALTANIRRYGDGVVDQLAHQADRLAASDGSPGRFHSHEVYFNQNTR
jgi:hypothetical protein